VIVLVGYGVRDGIIVRVGVRVIVGVKVVVADKSGVNVTVGSGVYDEEMFSVGAMGSVIGSVEIIS
jgi:accessory colonization factor AcfC